MVAECDNEVCHPHDDFPSAFKLNLLMTNDIDGWVEALASTEVSTAIRLGFNIPSREDDVTQTA